jgi:hypothetical protein
MWPAYLLGMLCIVLGVICGMGALVALLNGVDETEHFGRSAAWALILAIIAAAFIGGAKFIFKF